MVEPRLRGEQAGRDERDARLQPEPLRCAAPRPVLNLLHQAHGQRTSLDHHAAPNQRAGRGKWCRDNREAACVERSGRVAAGIPYPFNQRLEPLRSRRLDDEVPDPGQERERQQVRLMPGQDLPEGFEQRAVLGRPPQVGMWLDEAAGEVNVAGNGRVWHGGLLGGLLGRKRGANPEGMDEESFE